VVVTLIAGMASFFERLQALVFLGATKAMPFSRYSPDMIPSF
jgi:hypothetical protein